MNDLPIICPHGIGICCHCNECADQAALVVRNGAANKPSPSAATETPRVGQWFILKASYCHGRRTPGCTDANPCAECLKSCNRFVISGEHKLTKGSVFFFAPVLCSRDGDGYMESTLCSVLTEDEETLKEHYPYSNRISEALFIDSPEVEQLKADLASKTAELEEAKARIEGLDGRIQGYTDLIEQHAEALAATRQRCERLENFVKWVWQECDNHDGKRIRDAAWNHLTQQEPRT